MRSICVISILLLSLSVNAQVKDSLRVKKLDEVNVSLAIRKLRRVRLRPSVLNRRTIEELQVTDVGELLQKLEGATVRSYGGLGGLKTVSVRSLGSNHSAVIIDGFNVQNNQTGQINLGQIGVDNVEGALISVGSDQLYLTPVSSQIQGSTVLLQTFENTFDRDTLSIRASVRGGSFGRMGGYTGIKWNKKKWLFSGFGKYRQAHGRYPYSFQNGNTVEQGTRSNNAYQDYSAGSTIGWNNYRVQFRLGYRYLDIDQELPGAVILYNSTADEQLKTRDHTAFSDFNYRFNDQFRIRWYGSANQNTLRYIDPSFLNNSGGIDVEYNNRNVNSGVIASYNENNFLAFAGIEESVSDLASSDSLFSQPVRFHTSGIIGGKYRWGRVLKIATKISAQYVDEKSNADNSHRSFFRVNPFVSIETIPSEYSSDKYWKHALWYKNSFRVPTFNELYYNNIGNSSLLPEEANQFSYNLSFVPVERKLDCHVRSNLFFNTVRNKIVAIPTQNLFVWSIQNLGRVNIYGAEFAATVGWNTLGKTGWRIVGEVNYTFQQSIDVTDRSSQTYGHQVAYIPVHTGNADLSVTYRKWGTGFRISNYLTSKRYALNENIEANEVDGFIITDFMIFQRFKLKKRQQLNLQLSIKNVWNSSYAYIRSYVMPGRNLLISLSYAFH